MTLTYTKGTPVCTLKSLPAPGGLERAINSQRNVSLWNLILQIFSLWSFLFSAKHWPCKRNWIEWKCVVSLCAIIDWLGRESGVAFPTARQWCARDPEASKKIWDTPRDETVFIPILKRKKDIPLSQHTHTHTHARRQALHHIGAF